MQKDSLLNDLSPVSPERSGWPWERAAADPLPPTMSDGRPSPRVTVVTPSFNQGKFIEETIRSVLLQGYPNLEYIIMDGGSTDGTLEVIRKYEPWLSFLHVGPDGGHAAALVEGFKQSSGEIMAWLNSDDRYLPGALARAGSFFAQHPRVIFANGDVNFIDASGRVLQRLYTSGPTRFLTANLGAHTWPQQGCFWRRSAYERVGGVDGSLKFSVDRDLFIRLLGVGRGGRIGGPPLAEFRLHANSKTSTLLDVAFHEHLLLLSRYGWLRRENLRPLLRICWWLWRRPARIRALLSMTSGWDL